jgi:predicted ester cyclase
MVGKHKGEFMGIPATGNQLDVPTADVLRFENGKVVEHWGVTDSGAMLMQMGVVEMPG